jgi:hypothetical protein
MKRRHASSAIYVIFAERRAINDETILRSIADSAFAPHDALLSSAAVARPVVRA